MNINTEQYLLNEDIQYVDDNDNFLVKFIEKGFIKNHNKLSSKQNFQYGAFDVKLQDLYEVTFKDNTTAIIEVNIFENSTELPPQVFLQERLFS